MQRAQADHYDQKYFEWQKSGASLAASLEFFKFQPHVRQSDKVIDFGCGGGYFLASIQCAEKLGIEPNPSAQSECARNGVAVVPAIADAPDEWADVLISNHALEHVDAPLDVLRALIRKVKPGGKLILYVPCEAYSRKYDASDINQHLYTWSPLNLGNLAAKAGFEVIECRAMRNHWPKGVSYLHRYLGPKLTRPFLIGHGWLTRDIKEIRLIARRP
jgi:SAM-dependent methyltransferase